jgi:hypothetical protein
MSSAITTSLESVGADSSYEHFTFVLLAEQAFEITPPPVQGYFIMFAKCLFQKRSDPVYMKLLWSATFDCPETSFFTKRLMKAGSPEYQIQKFMTDLMFMFDTLSEKTVDEHQQQCMAAYLGNMKLVGRNWGLMAVKLGRAARKQRMMREL